jgi:CheY-like chemotaxis protein
MNRRIFLVEDDEDDVLLFKEIMKEIDNTILLDHADDGRKALKKLQTMEVLPNVIFLDLNMPCMNGFEFMHTIKNDERLRQLPIVIFTSSNNPEDVEKTHKLGANIFLSKPVEYGLMKEKLERILSFDFAGEEQDTVIQYSF